MSRADHEVRPTGGAGDDDRRSLLGFRRRTLDLIHGGRTFLRRRGIEHERIGGILLHRIDAPDPGLDLHDHPWPFVSIVLRGGYTEEAAAARHACDRALNAESMEHRLGHRLGSHERGERRSWRRGSVHVMPLVLAHRIAAVEPRTITLVLRGRKVRRWGFYLPTGWVDWEAYDYDARRPNTVVSDHADERMVEP